jgi:crotonobetainyl-CoA:carnitine CoA-transferase CaiB-like acyl-CoA transferase
MSVLDGIRVLDLSQGAAGPTAGAILGDHGAVVTKVEPIGGEWGRTLGPPFWHGTALAAVGMNRNKRSLAMDLRQPEGLALVRRLAEDADVLLESFRPGVMERLGLGYEELHASLPRLVYCSITAFGSTGPRRNQPGVDGVAQAIAGLMSITGTEDGESVKVGVPAADMSAALQAVQGVLLGLLARERGGEGQHIEVSLFDSLLSLQLIPLTMYLHSGEVPKPHGSGAAYSTPNEAFHTRDGAVMIAAYTPERWQALCRALDRVELVDDPRFATNTDRMAHRAALRDEIERSLAARDTDEWLEVLSSADLMCAPVVDYERLMADPQVEQNEMIVDLDHPFGTVRTVGIPVKLSETPGAVRGPAPLVGEQSRQLLREAGCSDTDIDELMAAGIVNSDLAAPQDATINSTYNGKDGA